MAYITLDASKLRNNYQRLDRWMTDAGKEWAVVTKMLCGVEAYLDQILSLGPRQVADSRISNLRAIKAINPAVETIYIKPPARRSIEDVVRYADISCNTEQFTIELLNEAARQQGTIHQVLIMIELGDLREGIMGYHLLAFYDAIRSLPHIRVVGIGTNLNCLNGVLPSEDKLIQLSLYAQLVEAKFNLPLRWISGGTSVILPLLSRGQVPQSINHFRIGETLYFGKDLLTNDPIPSMEENVFMLHSEIIEITEKPKVPIGYLGENPSHETHVIDEGDYGQTSFRAILDIGLLDADAKFLYPEDESLSLLGASSDMLVIDLRDNPKGYKVGDLIRFRTDYMGALHLLHSDYIGKQVIGSAVLVEA